MSIVAHTGTKDGKYLTFTQLPATTKTKKFKVTGRGTEITLGAVSFRPQWRCYVFLPDANTLYDFKCLTDITDFLQELNTEWRKSL